MNAPASCVLGITFAVCALPLQARLVQMLAIVVVQLLVYDSVKQLVGLPVTGTH